jgi:hypothetical protein
MHNSDLEQSLKLLLKYVLCLRLPLGAVRTEKVVESLESCWLRFNLHGNVLMVLLIKCRPCVPGTHAT